MTRKGYEGQANGMKARKWYEGQENHELLNIDVT